MVLRAVKYPMIDRVKSSTYLVLRFLGCFAIVCKVGGPVPGHKQVQQLAFRLKFSCLSYKSAIIKKIPKLSIEAAFSKVAEADGEISVPQLTVDASETQASSKIAEADAEISVPQLSIKAAETPASSKMAKTDAEISVPQLPVEVTEMPQPPRTRSFHFSQQLFQPDRSAQWRKFGRHLCVMSATRLSNQKANWEDIKVLRDVRIQACGCKQAKRPPQANVKAMNTEIFNRYLSALHL